MGIVKFADIKLDEEEVTPLQKPVIPLQTPPDQPAEDKTGGIVPFDSITFDEPPTGDLSQVETGVEDVPRGTIDVPQTPAVTELNQPDVIPEGEETRSITHPSIEKRAKVGTPMPSGEAMKFLTSVTAGVGGFLSSFPVAAGKAIEQLSLEGLEGLDLTEIRGKMIEAQEAPFKELPQIIPEQDPANPAFQALNVVAYPFELFGKLFTDPTGEFLAEKFASTPEEAEQIKAGVHIGGDALLLATPKAINSLKIIPKAVRNTNFYRNLTIKERGLVALTLDEMRAKGFTDAELARMNPSHFNELFEARRNGMNKMEPEAVGENLSESVSNMMRTRVNELTSQGIEFENATVQALEYVQRTDAGKADLQKIRLKNREEFSKAFQKATRSAETELIKLREEAAKDVIKKKAERGLEIKKASREAVKAIDKTGKDQPPVIKKAEEAAKAFKEQPQSRRGQAAEAFLEQEVKGLEKLTDRDKQQINIIGSRLSGGDVTALKNLTEFKNKFGADATDFVLRKNLKKTERFKAIEDNIRQILKAEPGKEIVEEFAGTPEGRVVNKETALNKPQFRVIKADTPIAEAPDHWTTNKLEDAQKIQERLEESTGVSHKILKIDQDAVFEAGGKPQGKSPYDTGADWIKTDAKIKPTDVEGVIGTEEKPVGEVVDFEEPETFKSKALNVIDSLIKSPTSTGHVRRKRAIAKGLNTNIEAIDRSAKRIKEAGKAVRPLDRKLIEFINQDRHLEGVGAEEFKLLPEEGRIAGEGERTPTQKGIFDTEAFTEKQTEKEVKAGAEEGVERLEGEQELEFTPKSIIEEAKKFKTSKDFIKTEAIRKKLEGTSKESGIKINSDNTVTLFHATLNLDKIKKEGVLKGGGTATGGMTGLALEPSVFLGTNKKWVKDVWGSARDIIEVKIPIKDVRQPSQNNLEVYVEGNLIRGKDGIWRPSQEPRTTFFDKLAERDLIDKKQLTDIFNEAKNKPQYKPEVLDFMKEFIEQGEAGVRQKTPSGETFAVPSSFPIWFKNKGLSKKGTINIINKALTGKPLTERQKGTLDSIYEKAEDEFSREGFGEAGAAIPPVEILVESIRKAKDSLPHLIELGKRTYKEGMNFRSFREKMKSTLGDLWNKFKTKMLDIFRKVRAEASRILKEEAGAIFPEGPDKVGKTGKIKGITAKKKPELIRTAKEILDRRRRFIRSVQQDFSLTDTDLKKITRQDIRLMTNFEFKKFIDNVRVKSVEYQETSQAKAELMDLITRAEFKKWNNLRQVMKLPPIEKMDKAQAEQFYDALQEYQAGDEFLSLRKLELVDRTDFQGIKTIREALDKTAKKIGVPLKDVIGTTVSEFERFKPDTQLAKTNPVFQYIVHKMVMRDLGALNEVLKTEKEINVLARKSRGSEKQTIAGKLIPQDKIVFEYIEADPQRKVELARHMTSANLDFAHYVNTKMSEALKYFMSTEALKHSRFEGAYITHVRKGLLESVKDKGLREGVRNMFDKYAHDEQVANILDSATDQILPLEKFSANTLFRVGKIDPTKNVAKAFMQYWRNYEKKKALDRTLPELDIIVHALEPKGETQRGLKIDKSLEKFFKEWVNTKKGRYTKAWIKQGGKLDITLRALKGFTSIFDLGANIIVGETAGLGEASVNFIQLGHKNFAKGITRKRTEQGRKITERYKNFIGKGVWEELSEASKDIGDKVTEVLFARFHSHMVSANKTFLLGSLTDAEFKTGIITPNRLAQLKLNMGEFRQVPGTSSVLGSTPEAGALLQYKRWAVAPLQGTFNNLKELSKNKKFNSKEAWQLYRAMEVVFVIATVGHFLLADRDNNTFIGRAKMKTYRELMSIYGALDATFWTSVPRVLSFIRNISVGIKQLITLEEYEKSSRKWGYEEGELKGLRSLKQTLIPRALTQFSGPDTSNLTPDEKKSRERSKLKSKYKISGEVDSPEFKSAVRKMKRENRQDYFTFRNTYKGHSRRKINRY